MKPRRPAYKRARIPRQVREALRAMREAARITRKARP